MSGRATLGRATAALLRPFSKVHPEEAPTLALMAVSSFLLLTAYYLLKTVREPLILLQGGAEVKLYARAGQTVIMVGVVHLYGELAQRVGRVRLLRIVFLFFISNLAVFAVLAKLAVPIGLAFFLWVGVFSYTVIAQFWGLAADIYDEEQGKRLFPLIGAGSSIGAVAGGLFAKVLVPFGPAVLMSTATVILLLCVGLISWIERRTRAVNVQHEAAPRDEPLAAESAWRLLARDRYLWFIAGMVIFLNWVNSSGEYVLDRTLVVAAKDAAAGGAVSSQTFIGEFKAGYYAWYNTIGVALQLLAVSRILATVGVRGALYFLPCFGVLAYGSAMFLPTLAVLRLVKIGENSLQYSLQDTTRHALFLVTSRAEKFVGKTAVDTIAVRLGAIMSALFVYVGSWFGWSTSTFAAINVVLALIWLGFVALIGRQHRRRELAAAAAT
ncbi:MAG TPA: Npt1/Npt2 family nucleotide transporter [Polyangia bacterium]|jgi:AAA family ATP:ADP antiporter|nr:Npt1/Npt2 family nucleotide transporter [Polyangia bacterium]